MAPNEKGAIRAKTAEGERDVGYVSPQPLDGSRDVVVIPSGRISGLVAGTDDPRRYNVSALLRSGQTDASEADLSALDDKTYGQFTPIDPEEPKSDGQRLDLTFTDHTGKQAVDVTASYVNVRTGDAGKLTVAEDGTASATLPAGEYDIVSSVYGTDEANVVAITPVTVADKPVKTTVDGTKAVKVDAKVDSADLTTMHQDTEVYTKSSAGYAMGVLSLAAENSSVYAIPVEAGQESSRRFTYRTTRTSKDSTDSVYNLAFTEDKGIPADLDYPVDPDELAAITTKYHSLAGKQTGNTSSCAVYDWQMVTFCQVIDTSFPSERQQYYTPGDQADWRHDTLYFGESEADAITMVRDTAEYQPGPGEVTVGAGPFGPNLSGGSIVRDGDDIIVGTSHIENPAADESVEADAVTGSTTLSKNGEVVDKADEPSADMTVPGGDSGRYTLSIDTTMDTDVTGLGTKGSAEWEFESKPASDFDPIDLSSVVFDADDVVNGTAPADEAQDFTLEYLPQDGAAEADAEKFTFEVSYDDGKTWDKVDIDADGNTASGTLKHPGEAEYVSYRTAASDDTGNKFSATAIRSYALS